MPDSARLEILKTLGDNTRYAIYLEIARAARPKTTAEIAESLGLHPNTVRPHLERMRDLGLVEVSSMLTGSVGRPQHRYALAADAPSLGLEPPVVPMLTKALLDAAASAGMDPDEVVDAGRESGRALRARSDHGEPVDLLERALGELGFDPTRVDEDGAATIAFTHCPFRELAEGHPDLVCGMHQGLVEGFLDGDPDEVQSFSSLVARTPCQVTVACAPAH